MTSAGALVPLDGFYHYGLVVADFDAALLELGSELGLEWASVQRRTFEVRQPNGLVTADFRVTYSVTGPPHFEVIEPTPGTIWRYDGGFSEADFGHGAKVWFREKTKIKPLGYGDVADMSFLQKAMNA